MRRTGKQTRRDPHVTRLVLAIYPWSGPTRIRHESNEFSRHGGCGGEGRSWRRASGVTSRALRLRLRHDQRRDSRSALSSSPFSFYIHWFGCLSVSLWFWILTYGHAVHFGHRLMSRFWRFLFFLVKMFYNSIMHDLGWISHHRIKCKFSHELM